MLSRFFRDRRGNVVPIFAIALVPMIGFVGATVDYSRASATRTSMQAAVDATALMLSKEATGLTAEQLSTKATAYFNNLFARPEAKGLTVTTTYAANTSSFTVKVTASASVDATIARVLGKTEMGISASSEVVWGIKRIELALALDNTGSMASNSKMTELKKAAKNLVDTLKAAAKKPDDVKIAIIPFDTGVNLGTDYKNEEWLNFSNVGEWQYSNYYGWQWVQGNKDTWQGCVTDRDQNYDVQDTTPSTANPSTIFPAVNCGSLAKMMPLTNEWTALTNKIDSMQPSGNTNVTIGLVWAWHALTSNLPFTQASAPQPDLDKVIILLTDGTNTQNRWSSSSSQIDARTTKACENIKAAGIKLYTVRVIDGNATMLKECASKVAMFYDVQTASQLNIVFGTIAQNLANLRISK